MELIITEKPSSAEKVANALSRGSPDEKRKGQVKFYEFRRDDTEITVVSAVGHLFSVKEKEKSFEYPSFELEWAPIYEVNKDSDYAKKYLDVIKDKSEEADEFTVACDYDIEGEVIGLKIIEYATDADDANRMKFSTLVQDDVKESYKNKRDTLDWGQGKAGETRHQLDWLYGINLSRALTLSMKEAGRFKLMSSGRVQGPALKIVVEKEKKIQAFDPEPYWVLTGTFDIKGEELQAKHKKKKFFDKEEAKNVLSKTKKDKGEIANVKKNKYKQYAPNPFDLGKLQRESYKLFNISPKQTLQIAQDLYSQGYTSYPRTSSQKLPKNIGYKKILNKLKNNKKYKENSNRLLNMKYLSPNNGKKNDPAHPAIYPTGVKPKGLNKNEGKVYDLIVKRFMATFGKPALRETVRIQIDVEDELFKTKGTRTLTKNWHELYHPYVTYKETKLPGVEEGEDVDVKDISSEEKETKPPKRYTQSSLISELEKKGLGTKATRANIIQNLYDRGYIVDNRIKATRLGMTLVDTLGEYCSLILDEDFTREIEQDMEDIREEKEKPDTVLEKAKTNLKEILEYIKEHQEEIGEDLIEAQDKTRDELNNLGECPVCEEGSLMIRDGKYGQFAACDEYPDCKTTFSLPNDALIKPTDKVSDTGHPIVKVIKKGKKPQEISVNPDDNLDDDVKKILEEVENGERQISCPECGEDMRVVSGSYGKFLGCTDYPDCEETVGPDEIEDLLS